MRLYLPRGEFTSDTSVTTPDGTTYLPASNLPSGKFPAGTIVQFAIPTASSGPFGIAAANGYVWFTESAAGKIGRLDASTGTVCEFPIPMFNGPGNIAADSGDNLWISRFGGAAV